MRQSSPDIVHSGTYSLLPKSSYSHNNWLLKILGPVVLHVFATPLRHQWTGVETTLQRPNAVKWTSPAVATVSYMNCAQGSLSTRSSLQAVFSAPIEAMACAFSFQSVAFRQFGLGQCSQKVAKQYSFLVLTTRLSGKHVRLRMDPLDSSPGFRGPWAPQRSVRTSTSNAVKRSRPVTDRVQ